jgi:methionyl-tRNA formyltransferase
MRVLFIGGTKRGYMALSAMLESGIPVCGIINLKQDEHEIERYEAAIESLAVKFGIQHYLTKAMADADYAAIVRDTIRPDIAFVVGCRILLPREIYSFPRLGTLAVHDSLLPDYRGFAPLNWAMINGESRTGVTLFYLDERMDGGDIAGQRAVAIGADETAPQVYERICRETVALCLESYQRLAAGTATRVKQDYGAGSFTCSRTPGDGLIDWVRSTSSIYAQVRALAYPYPGAFTYFQGKKLTVWKAVPVSDRQYVGRIPGRVVGLSRAEGYADVLTGDGILRLLEVQEAGAASAAPASIMKSVRSTLGLGTVELYERLTRLEPQIEGPKSRITGRDSGR